MSCFIFLLNQKVITSNKLNKGFLSIPSLVPWLLFRARVVTDQFCWILLHFNRDKEGIKGREDGERGGRQAKQSVFFFSKSVTKSVQHAVRVLRPRKRASLSRPKGVSIFSLSPEVSFSVLSLVPDLLFDCSRVLEYANNGLFCSLRSIIIQQMVASHYCLLRHVANANCLITVTAAVWFILLIINASLFDKAGRVSEQFCS